MSRFPPAAPGRRRERQFARPAGALLHTRIFAVVAGARNDLYGDDPMPQPSSQPSSQPSPSNTADRLAQEHPALVRLGRAGWLAKGIVYLVAGVLALIVVGRSFGWDSGGDQEASPTGALKEVANASGGRVLVWILAVGLFLYAAWRLTTALLPGSTDASGWVHRIGYALSAVVYATLGITAIDLSTGEEQAADGNQQITDWTQRIMQNSAGRWLVGLAGVVLLGLAAYRIYKGVTSDVEDELDVARLGSRRRSVQRLGAIGEIGRGVAIGCIGFFLVRAAVTFRADEATGLDGALRRLAEQWWGVALVAIVGIGFIAYGIFCTLTFRYRRLEAP